MMLEAGWLDESGNIFWLYKCDKQKVHQSRDSEWRLELKIKYKNTGVISINFDLSPFNAVSWVHVIYEGLGNIIIEKLYQT